MVPQETGEPPRRRQAQQPADLVDPAGAGMGIGEIDAAVALVIERRGEAQIDFEAELDQNTGGVWSDAVASGLIRLGGDSERGLDRVAQDRKLARLQFRRKVSGV